MNKKIIIYILILVAVLVVIYFFFFAGNGQPKVVNAPSITENQVSTATTTEKFVSIANFAFNPATVNISKGATVVWTNNDSAPHQIVGDSLSGQVMNKGQIFSQVFNNVGTFNYHCAIHPSMKGIIIVQ